MLDYDPVTSLRHYPIPMSRFGKNEHGENLYRIVFTESRRHLVGGAWQSKCKNCEGYGQIGGLVCTTCGGRGAGEVERGYHYVPKYRAVSSPWILERWYDPFTYTRMTRMQWDTQMVDPVSGWLLFGPYPSRGEYDLIWEFDEGVCSDNLDQIIAASNFGRERSFQDVKDFHSAEYAYEEKETRDRTYADFRSGLRAFGNAPMSAGRFGRGTKTVPEALTANELGLPMPGGKYRDIGGGYGARSTFFGG